MPKTSISTNPAAVATVAAAAKTTAVATFLRRFSSEPIFSPSSSTVPTHDHIADLILDQRSATGALRTFRWASSLPNFRHSQSTYRALIHKLCSFRRFDTAHHLLDEMPSSIGSPPDDSILVTVVRGLGRARMIRESIKVLDLAARFGHAPSLKLFNSILDVLVKEDIDLAREFYRTKMMGNGVVGDDYTYGILMKGLCLTNRIGDGFKLLQLIKSRGVVPNTVIYNTLIHGLCRNGNVGRARSFMNEMEEPNDVTFNILISAYCKDENFIQAMVLLEKSFSLGFVPDLVTVTKVVDILCDKGRANEALEVLERVESKGGSLDVVAYNALIKGFCKMGKAKIGHRFLKVMEGKGCFPNVETYNVLISGFCDVGMFDFALDLFDDMKTDGISWNFVTYDALIKGLCSGGRIEEGYKILGLLQESKFGSLCRISPYNSVLYGLYKKDRVDEAFEFLTNMGRLFPRAVDRSLRILGLCKEGEIKEAKRVYDQMTGEGGTPSALVYDLLIHGFCSSGCLREAFDMVNEMIDRGYFPVASTFNALIAGFCEQEKVESAMKLMEDMVGRGGVLDAGSYNPIIDALCRKGDFEKAMILVHQMVEDDVLPDRHTWSSLLACQKTDWFRSNGLLHVRNMVELITET